jgi:hypothetical protein
MDDVQFQKNGLQNRNIIKTPTGNSYLTLPVFSKSNSLINEVNITNKIYLKKILKSLKQNYAKSKYFDFVFDNINELVKNKNYIKLHEFNKDLIMLSLKLMNAEVDLKFSSDFSLSSKKDDLVLELILSLKQNKYIMGSGGLNYMNLNKFTKNDIELYQYKFNYRNYNQLWPKIGFVKNLSIIDLLFNELETAKDYILSNGKLELLKDCK